MTWSYAVADLATSQKDQVRRLIGDVIATEPQIADEEIAFALTQRSNIYGAAADCARYIAAQFSRKTDIVTAGAGGQLKQNYSNQAKAYSALAAAMENLSIARGGALPYAGGISVADKILNEQDADRVAPQFNLGMEDNYIPVGPVGNETQTGTENQDIGDG